MICNHFGIICVRYNALLAKNSGIVNNCTRPNILSRLFIKVDTPIDKLENPIPRINTMPATAAKCNGLKLIFTPIIRAITKIVAASNSPLIPPVNDFPSTIAVLGIGAKNSFPNQ